MTQLTKMSRKGTFVRVRRTSDDWEAAWMGRRGSNSFRKNDGLRALRVARDGGLDPTAMEIVVGTDGAVTFRVFGKDAAGLMPLVPTTAGEAREWQDEIDKLKKPT